MKKLITTVSSIALAAASISAYAYTGGHLSKQATISTQQARAIAEKAFHGKIMDEKLEKDSSGGSGLCYSIDIQTTTGMRKICIDAVTGNVLEIYHETSRAEASAAPSEYILNPHTPIEVSRTPKRFDLMTVDNALHRLIVAHSQAGTLTVVDLVHYKLEREIPVGTSSGVAIDKQDNKYFVGTDQGIAVVDRSVLRKTGFIATQGPADAMVFDPRNDRLYVGHDDGKEIWVVDARKNNVIGHIAIPGAPELMAIDTHTHRLYLNIRTRDEVIVISTNDNQIVSHWMTRPTSSPHGLALDLKDQRLFVAGHSRIVSVFALPTGKHLKNIDIGSGHVDQIAFDAQAHRLYCPNHGKLVVIKVTSHTNDVLGSIHIPKGTHSVAIDPRTHLVWIAYATDHSYVQAFTPK